MMTIGKKIAELRQVYGLSQERLAKKLNVHRVTVTHWECEDSTPSLEQLKTLATMFGITLDELCCFQTELANRISEYDAAVSTLQKMDVGTVDNNDIVNLKIYDSIYDVFKKDVPELVKQSNIQYEKMLSRVNQGMFNAALLLTLNNGKFTFRFKPNRIDDILDRIYFYFEKPGACFTRNVLADMVKEDFLFLGNDERDRAWKQVLDALVKRSVLTPEEAEKWQCPVL